MNSQTNCHDNVIRICPDMSTTVKGKSVDIEYQPYVITCPYMCIVISLQP